MRTVIVIACAVLLAASAPAQTAWQLVWNDEFNGTAGSPPDPANWNYDLGGGGWGNGEAETYTNSTNNVSQDGAGNLVIRAIRDSSGNYTSARLQTAAALASTNTANTNWQYGRIEARMKLPFGQGVWPAFWMLGSNIASFPWPNCGEIDIMENFGTFLDNEASMSHGTAHGPGYSGGDGISASTTLPFGETVYDDYHIYAIEWSKDSIQWFLDGVMYHTVTPADIPPGDAWAFNQPFFILLNLAIGGPTTFLGTPDPHAPFPDQDLLVDYVRVYQAHAFPENTPAISPGRVVNAASYLGSVAPGALAVLYGTDLADDTYQDVFDNGRFVTSLHGVTVTVDGRDAPLVYVSPTQINFQIPWETAPGPAVDVQVTRNGLLSQVETMTIAANAAPSMFFEDFTSGIAWMTATGCETTECVPQAGAAYQLWANGLGPKNEPEQDGVPVVFTGGSLAPLEVLGGTTNCQLTINGLPTAVLYCGAAPGEIIDQVNFTYPSGVSSSTPYADAVLTINGATGRFRVPAPAP